MAGQRLVDGVVDHLVDHVVEAGAVIGVADIHARPLAHGVQAAQHLDRIRAIAFAGGLGVVGQVLAFLVQIKEPFSR